MFFQLAVSGKNFELQWNLILRSLCTTPGGPAPPGGHRPERSFNTSGTMTLPSDPELVGLKQKNTTNFKNLWILVCFLLKNKRFPFNRVEECWRENLGTEARNSDLPSGPPSRCVNLAMSLGPFACKSVSRRRGGGGGGGWRPLTYACSELFPELSRGLEGS